MSLRFWGVCNVRGGSTLRFCFSAQPDAAHRKGKCPKEQDAKLHTMQRVGEPDENESESLARLKKPLHVGPHLKSHRSAASLGSCRTTRNPPTPTTDPSEALTIPRRGQLGYLPDPHSARRSLIQGLHSGNPSGILT